MEANNPSMQVPVTTGQKDTPIPKGPFLGVFAACFILTLILYVIAPHYSVDLKVMNSISLWISFFAYYGFLIFNRIKQQPHESVSFSTIVTYVIAYPLTAFILSRVSFFFGAMASLFFIE